jgi:hypothetical protein
MVGTLPTARPYPKALHCRKSTECHPGASGIAKGVGENDRRNTKKKQTSTYDS